MTARPPAMRECDVAVIGAGPAGMAAAARAAEGGARVIVIDESPRVGGQIWRHGPNVPPSRVARDSIDRLSRSGALVLSSTSVIDVDVQAERIGLTAESCTGAERIGCRSLVLATGARELFLPFPGWTTPGVLGIGAAQALMKSGTSFRGKRVVIAGTGPLMLPVAASLTSHGARLSLVAEQAAWRAVASFAASLWRAPDMLAQAAWYRAAFAATPYRTGCWVSAARGDGQLEEIDLTDGRRVSTVPCDVLCAAFGLVPNTEVARLIGCRIADGFVVVDGAQRTSVPNVFCAGEPTGIGGVDLAVLEGEIAGASSVGSAVDVERPSARARALRTRAARMRDAFALRPELRQLAADDTIVCRCEDVAFGAIGAGWTMRQVKLYTRAGMGPCQGRICGPALEFLHDCAPDRVRAPLEPAQLSTFLA